MRRVRLVGRLTPERRRDVHREVAELSQPSTTFYVMVAISSTIAAYGLLANSTAVVIGAMLVAPLMGPIFGVSLGLATGERRLLGRAIVAEVAGVVLVLAVSAAIGSLPLRLDFGTEVQARVQPTLYDIIVALAAGLAGAYAVIDERVSPALPGVAVAVAVVPPLATCGLCVAAARWDWALGALLLFVANFLAILLAAAIVFAVAGMATVGVHRTLTVGSFVGRFWVTMLLLVVVGAFLTRTLVTLVRQRQLQRRVETVLADELRSAAGAQLSATTFTFTPSHTAVTATVITPTALEAPQVARIQDVLRREAGAGTDLVLRSLISRDFDAKGPVFVSPDAIQAGKQAARETAFLTTATSALTNYLKGVLGAHLTEVRREQRTGRDVVVAVVRTPSVITPDQVAQAEAAVQHAVGMPVRLVIRSVLARDADSGAYLYQPSEPAAPRLSPAELAATAHLRRAVERLVAALQPGAYLTELREVRANDRWRVLAVVRTPAPIGPVKVAEAQDTLRRWVDPQIDLIVRSDLGADATAGAYVAGLDDKSLLPTNKESASPAP